VSIASAFISFAYDSYRSGKNYALKGFEVYAFIDYGTAIKTIAWMYARGREGAIEITRDEDELARRLHSDLMQAVDALARATINPPGDLEDQIYSYRDYLVEVLQNMFTE